MGLRSQGGNRNVSLPFPLLKVDNGLRVFARIAAAMMRRLPKIEITALTLALLGTLPTFAQQGIDLNGKAIDPWKVFPEKAVVLVFIRTDCPIANRYAPTIQRLSAEYAGKAAFWLVYPDKDESAAAVLKHLHDYGYKIPALRDPKHELVARSQAKVTPEAAVFDSNGQLVYHGRIDNWYERFGRARLAPTTHELNDSLAAAVAGTRFKPRQTTPVGCYISDLR